jgi:hypothetical protein
MGSAFGAGAGADMLQEVLRRKFTEAIQQQAMQRQIAAEQAQEQHYKTIEQQNANEYGLREKMFEASQKPEPPKPVEPKRYIVNGRLVDESGKELYASPDKPTPPPVKRGPVSVAPGGYLVDPETGKQIYHAPERPEKPAAGGQQPQQNEIDDTLALIDQIRKDPSRAAATGPIDSRGLGMVMDTGGVTRVNALHNQLVGKMSLAQAGKLKGQGQISDKERQLLRDAATALTQHLQDPDYLNELDKVEAQFRRMKAGGAAAPTGAPSKSGFRVVGEVK